MVLESTMVVLPLCLVQPGFADNTSDCDDTNADSFPGADEYCNGIDNDCDGVADNSAVDGLVYYLDLDGDGFGDPTTEDLYCTPPANGVTDDTDCDDSSAVINISGTETCSDGLDNDCNGSIDCDDPSCGGSSECGETNCTDGIDDDNDGYMDCLDSECIDSWQCNEDCDNQIDDNNNGLFDCEDLIVLPTVTAMSLTVTTLAIMTTTALLTVTISLVRVPRLVVKPAV